MGSELKSILRWCCSADKNNQKKYQQPPGQTCEICTQPLNQKFALSCQHHFHKTCISEYLKVRIAQKAQTMPCPSGCGSELSYSVLKLALSALLFKQHEKNLMQNLVQNKKENIYCPTPNCVGIYEIEDYTDQFFFCQFCGKGYCLICRKDEHQGFDCNFQEERASINAMIIAGMKPCPYCERMVEKIDGCCSVKCRCGKEFCYTCGGITCPHGKCTKVMQR